MNADFKAALVQTIYNGERYEVPYSEMGSWLAYIRDLSFFRLDCGNLQIAFSDKFSKYLKKYIMEQTEVLEGNRIIAEFMGIIMEDANSPYNLPKYYYPDNDERKKGKFADYFHELEYNSSWGWIMPVIEKIEKMGYYTNILSADNDNTKHTIHITPLDDDEQYTLWYNSKIEAVWIGVVKFIKAEIQNVSLLKD